MTRTEINKFRRMLTTKQTELTQAGGRRDGIAIERTPDALDEVTFAAQRELTTRSLERESRLMHNVNAALGRIAEGTYGTCLECDEEISQKRLHAVPWATLCIACQQRRDENSRRRFASPQKFLMDAA